jgi:hypothetical protein
LQKYNRDELKVKIDEKEIQLNSAERESNVWNSGRFKSSSNVKVSKIFVDSLRKEIKEFHEQLYTLDP